MGRQLAQAQLRNGDLGYDRYRIGKTRLYTLTFRFEPERVAFTRTMRESFFDPKIGPVDRLPEPFRQATEEARRQILSNPDEVPTPPVVKP